MTGKERGQKDEKLIRYNFAGSNCNKRDYAGS